MTWLKENERIDELHRNGYRIIQNAKKFCFGMDAVLLSGFASVRPGGLVLDLGTGTGILPILLAAKTEGAHFTGLEILPDMADMARRSVSLNGLEQKIDIVTGDIIGASKRFGGASFDVITCNPPYMENHHGLKSTDMAKAIARHEILCCLKDVVEETAALLKPSGYFYMVHRPGRLAEILTLMSRYQVEPKRMRLVHSRRDKEAGLVLIAGVKGAGRELRVEKPLIVYREDGGYTDEIYEIYGYTGDRRPKETAANPTASGGNEGEKDE